MCWTNDWQPFKSAAFIVRTDTHSIAQYVNGLALQTHLQLQYTLFVCMSHRLTGPMSRMTLESLRTIDKRKYVDNRSIELQSFCSAHMVRFVGFSSPLMCASCNTLRIHYCWIIHCQVLTVLAFFGPPTFFIFLEITCPKCFSPLFFFIFPFFLVHPTIRYENLLVLANRDEGSYNEFSLSWIFWIGDYRDFLSKPKEMSIIVYIV